MIFILILLILSIFIFINDDDVVNMVSKKRTILYIVSIIICSCIITHSLYCVYWEAVSFDRHTNVYKKCYESDLKMFENDKYAILNIKIIKDFTKFKESNKEIILKHTILTEKRNNKYRTYNLKGEQTH